MAKVQNIESMVKSIERLLINTPISDKPLFLTCRLQYVQESPQLPLWHLAETLIGYQVKTQRSDWPVHTIRLTVRNRGPDGLLPAGVEWTFNISLSFYPPRNNKHSITRALGVMGCHLWVPFHLQSFSSSFFMQWCFTVGNSIMYSCGVTIRLKVNLFDDLAFKSDYWCDPTIKHIRLPTIGWNVDILSLR